MRLHGKLPRHQWCGGPCDIIDDEWQIALQKADSVGAEI